MQSCSVPSHTKTAPDDPLCLTQDFLRVTSAMATAAPPASQSLVKYDNPLLVSGGKGKGKGKAPAAPGKALPPVDGKQLTQTEDILNSILPPRCACACCYHAS